MKIKFSNKLLISINILDAVGMNDQVSIADAAYGILQQRGDFLALTKFLLRTNWSTANA
jgi:hypothetical protein